MSNLGDFIRTIDGAFGINRATLALPGSTATPPVVHQAFDLWVNFLKAAADGAAGTTTADTFIWTNPFDFSLFVTAGRIITLGAAIAADPTNNATIAIKTDNGVGGPTAVALTGTTTAGDLGSFVSNQSRTFNTVTPANQVLVPGGNLWFNIAKGGTGVVVPISQYFIRLQRGEY